MPELKFKMQIVLGCKDPVIADMLKTAFLQNEYISGVSIITKTRSIQEILSQRQANAVVINIFDLGIKDSLNCIEYVRNNYPEVPFCLLGTYDQLQKMPNVPERWQIKFIHYYKLFSDRIPSDIAVEANQVALQLAHYWLSKSAKVRLRDLRNIILHGVNKDISLSKESSREINEIVEVAENALEAKTHIIEIAQIVPGFEATDVQGLVKETLKTASAALEKTATVNKAILTCGAGLVIVSLIVSIITKEWEATAFGGFGIAGVIASLITNPLKSIGIGARRLVQIQMAYLSFLNQLSLLNRLPEGDAKTTLDRSKQLETVTNNLQQTLEKYF